MTVEKMLVEMSHWGTVSVSRHFLSDKAAPPMEWHITFSGVTHDHVELNLSHLENDLGHAVRSVYDRLIHHLDLPSKVPWS